LLRWSLWRELMLLNTRLLLERLMMRRLRLPLLLAGCAGSWRLTPLSSIRHLHLLRLLLLLLLLLIRLWCVHLRHKLLRLRRRLALYGGCCGCWLRG